MDVPTSDVIFEHTACHTRRDPVFVIGFARSGTSLTCRLLRRYLKVSFGTESQFIIRYYRNLHVYGDLSQEANVRGLLGDIAGERFFARCHHNWGFVFNREKAFVGLRERTYAGVLDAIFSQLAEHNRMSRWGDKTPGYNSDLPLLLRLFPNAQFIHVVRDGRDVALSIPKTSFGPTNACETAMQWKPALRAIEAFSRTLRADQFFELRYEDLIEQPVTRLMEIAGFLGIDDSDRRLAGYLEAHVRDEVRAANSEKWRRELSAADIERFEGVAGDTLARFGYSLVYRGNARRVSAVEQAIWRARARAARLILPTSWPDNWYRLALRTRAWIPRTIRRARVP